MSNSEPTDMDPQFMDSLDVDLFGAILLLGVVQDLLGPLDHVAPDGRRIAGLDKAEAVLAAGIAHLSAMMAAVDGQILCWRAVAKQEGK